MSSAAQTACPNGHSSVSVNKSNSYIYTDNDVREETVLEKQTVKITTPPYTLNSLSKGHSSNCNDSNTTTTDHENVVTYNEDQYLNLELKDLRTKSSYFPPGFRIYSGSQWETNGNRLLMVDRECQTDLLLAEPAFNFRMMTNDQTTTALHNSPGTSSTSGSSSSGIVMDDLDNVNKSSNEDLIETEKDDESKDRDLEHIHVVVNDSRLSATVISEQPEAVTLVEENKPFKEIDIEPDDQIDHRERFQDTDKREDNDSCCVDCMYVAFNVCECSIM